MVKKVAKNKDEIFIDTERHIGITAISNLAQPESFYEKKSVHKFILWLQDPDRDYYLSDERYYEFTQLCDLFGYLTSAFTVWIPKEENPFVFQLDKMLEAER